MATYLVYFPSFWFILPILVCCTKKNLASLIARPPGVAAFTHYFIFVATNKQLFSSHERVHHVYA
jgi:hypothetical protein